MKKFLKRAIILFVALFSVLFCAGTSLAAGMIDPDAPASLSLNYRYESQKLAGVTFRLYKVAAVTPYVTFTLTPKFSAYPIQTEGQTVEGWNEQAVLIKGYVQADGISPDYTLVTNADGDAATALSTGLYLVIGEKRSIGGYTYTAAPSLVCIPMLSDTDEWMYDYAIVPKVTRTKNPDPPVPDPPIEPKKPAVPETERRVIIVWDDGDDEEGRPTEVPVILMRDGVPYGTASLNAENGWAYTWKGLPEYDEKGQKIEWSISFVIDGYDVLSDQTGATFYIQARKKVVKKGNYLPQTGLVWWPVPLLLAAGLVLVIAGVLRRREENI